MDEVYPNLDEIAGHLDLVFINLYSKLIQKTQSISKHKEKMQYTVDYQSSDMVAALQ